MLTKFSDFNYTHSVFHTVYSTKIDRFDRKKWSELASVEWIQVFGSFLESLFYTAEIFSKAFGFIEKSTDSLLWR